MERITITQFYRFLDSLGLFGEFWAEFYKIRSGRRLTLREFKNFPKLPPAEYLPSAFPWDDTDAGREFWENVHRRWLRRIDCDNQK